MSPRSSTMAEWEPKAHADALTQAYKLQCIADRLAMGLASDYPIAPEAARIEFEQATQTAEGGAMASAWSE